MGKNRNGLTRENEQYFRVFEHIQLSVVVSFVLELQNNIMKHEHQCAAQQNESYFHVVRVKL